MKTINKSTENITTFDEHLDSRYGKIGTMKRTEFEIKAKAFAIGEVIKEERRLVTFNFQHFIYYWSLDLDAK